MTAIPVRLGALLAGLVLVAACTGSVPGSPTPPAGSPASPAATSLRSASPSRSAPPSHAATPSLETVDPLSGLPFVAVGALPAQAAETLVLISAGGPFPFSADGITFENREGILPDKTAGYYREYTVITPGSADRGARRIVTGMAGEAYYSGDHYDSFRRIRLP